MHINKKLFYNIFNTIMDVKFKKNKCKVQVISKGVLKDKRVEAY